jgi:hypothetical protein
MKKAIFDPVVISPFHFLFQKQAALPDYKRNWRSQGLLNFRIADNTLGVIGHIHE